MVYTGLFGQKIYTIYKESKYYVGSVGKHLVLVYVL